MSENIKQTECRDCGADIVATVVGWTDTNKGEDGTGIVCPSAPRPNYGPHIPLTRTAGGSLLSD